MCAAGYDGPSRPAWPMPPSACDPATAQRSLLGAIENARIAEAAGFDWISVSEHHFSPITLTPSPNVMAGVLSQVIRRATIAVLGPILPLNNPVRIAEELAMLDCMTQGRLVALFLRGTPNEQLTYNDVAARSRAMTQEGIELILKTWTALEPFSWEGAEYQFKTISAWPRPIQSPHPPVFASGNSEESVIFAAQRKLSIAISFAPPDTVKKWVALYHAECDKAGWQPTRDNVLYRHIAHIADSDALAREQMAEAAAARASSAATHSDSTAREMGGPAAPPSPRPALFQPFFFGGPRTFTERVATMRDCGVGIVDFAFGIPGVGYQAQALKTFGAKVQSELARL